MERTFKLEQKELTALGKMDQERTQILAQWAALSIELKGTEQRLNTVGERQRSFISSALLHRGVEQSTGWQIINDSLIATVADEEMPALAAPVSEGKRLNGAPAVE